ncbi:UNVERIFIED_CONTAM: hypothetical protein HDU68_009929 [Siphonaria sp. JEL0065]|nr:hypothetical protein HDU68_009929 [Siphonaria sp. JEL0065]
MRIVAPNDFEDEVDGVPAALRQQQQRQQAQQQQRQRRRDEKLKKAAFAAAVRETRTVALDVFRLPLPVAPLTGSATTLNNFNNHTHVAHSHADIAVRDAARRAEKEALIKEAQRQNDQLMAFLDTKLSQLKLEAETKAKQIEERKRMEEEAKRKKLEREQEEEDRKMKAIKDAKVAQIEKDAKVEKDAKDAADADGRNTLQQQQQQQQHQQFQLQQQQIQQQQLSTIPTATPPPPQQQQQQRVSSVPKNVITSEEAWDSAVHFLGVVRDIKSSVKPAVAAFAVQDSAFAMVARQAKMKINMAVGQVTRSKPQIFHVATTIHKLLEAATTQFQKYPEYYSHLLDLTAKALTCQADAEVSVHPIKAPALAQVACLIIEKHPALLAVLLGRLMKRCPYIVPMYFKKGDEENLDDFNKRRRFKRQDEAWESEERYNERMCGMIRFYAGVTQVKTNSHMYEIDFGWQWMARVLNINPRKITPQLICSFLQIAGHCILQTYKSQAEKLFVYLYNVFLPKMMTLSVPSAMKLQIFLEEDDNFIKTGKMPVLKGSELLDQ